MNTDNTEAAVLTGKRSHGFCFMMRMLVCSFFSSLYPGSFILTVPSEVSPPLQTFPILNVFLPPPWALSSRCSGTLVGPHQWPTRHPRASGERWGYENHIHSDLGCFRSGCNCKFGHDIDSGGLSPPHPHGLSAQPAAPHGHPFHRHHCPRAPGGRGS